MATEGTDAAAAAEWWKRVRSQGAEFYAAGKVIDLPVACVSKMALAHDVLLVREVFDALYEEIVSVLESRRAALCHLTGNSGVGKSAFLWYFLIRTGIDRPDSIMVLETGPWIWSFHGADLTISPTKKYRFDDIESPDVTCHLIDQKVTYGRPIGKRALVAASPDGTNTKHIKKVRLTYTRYLPVWDKREFDLLVELWKSRAAKLEETASTVIEALEIREKVAAAESAFFWFGGIPRLLWDREEGRLAEADFHSAVVRCLMNTKLKNGIAWETSWSLLHFSVKPGSSFKYHQYTFCSERVANLYAQHLCRTNKLRKFIEAWQPFGEYSALRGFVFEQYVISQVLAHNIIAMPMVDTADCQHCSQRNDQGSHGAVPWIQCETCLTWYHTKCVQVESLCVFKCINCTGDKPKPRAASPSGLILRYYEGDLEDVLLAAGEGAVRYLWRPLRKSNAVFDLVLPPRTLGQATVSLDHKPVLEATIKAQKALKSWRDEFHPDDKNDDTLLAFFVPPDRYQDFKFQPYRSSRKVSQRAVKGIVQCKVAVPVSSSPYARSIPPDMDYVSVDLKSNPETWQDALGCTESTEDISEPAEKSLLEEKYHRCQQNMAYKGSELDDLKEIRNLANATRKPKRLQALSKMHKMSADRTNDEMLADLEALRMREPPFVVEDSGVYA